MNKATWAISILALAAGAGWLAWRMGTPDSAPGTPARAVTTAQDRGTARSPRSAPAPTAAGLSLAARLRDALSHGGTIAALLKDWLPHAGEDPTLSMRLATELLECEALAPNEEDFIAHGAAAMSNAEKAEVARDLNRRSSLCDDIDPEARDQLKYDLVTAAANAGSENAQTGYTFFAGPYIRSERSMVRDGIRETYKRDAVRFAQAALASHSRAAYDNAYRIHASDLYGARDPVAAYAYLLKATEGVHPALAAQLKANAAAGMTVDQLAQAQRMAHRLPMAPDAPLDF